MKLYYTTSAGYNSPQVKVPLSIGGFKSSNEVLNDDFSNLFDEISAMTVRTDRDQYIGLILKNDSDNIAAEVKCWFVTNEDDVCSLQIAAVTTAIDPNSGHPSMERIGTINSKPYVGQFYSPTEEDCAAIGNMEPQQEIGLWIKRSLKMDKVKDQYEKVAERDVKTQTRWREIDKQTREKIDFVVDWKETSTETLILGGKLNVNKLTQWIK